MNNTIKTILISLAVAIAAALVVVGLSGSGTKLGAQVQNDLFYFTGGIKVGNTSQFSVSNAGVITTSGAITTTGALTTASQTLVNGSATTTEAIGSSAIGTNKGKICLWNGTQYSIISFAAGSTTTSVATSTSCN